jgi:hypothetical protein
MRWSASSRRASCADSTSWQCAAIRSAGINRIACEQFLDRDKRQPELAQHRDKARGFVLREVVVAITRDLVHGLRRPQAVEPGVHLDGEARPPYDTNGRSAYA